MQPLCFLFSPQRSRDRTAEQIGTTNRERLFSSPQNNGRKEVKVGAYASEEHNNGPLRENCKALLKQTRENWMEGNPGIYLRPDSNSKNAHTLQTKNALKRKINIYEKTRARRNIEVGKFVVSDAHCHPPVARRRRRKNSRSRHLAPLFPLSYLSSLFPSSFLYFRRIMEFRALFSVTSRI